MKPFAELRRTSKFPQMLNVKPVMARDASGKRKQSPSIFPLALKKGPAFALPVKAKQAYEAASMEIFISSSILSPTSSFTGRARTFSAKFPFLWPQLALGAKLKSLLLMSIPRGLRFQLAPNRESNSASRAKACPSYVPQDVEICIFKSKWKRLLI